MESESSERGHVSIRKTRSNVPVKEKMAGVLRVLAGEDVEAVAESLGVSARRLGEWRETFLAGAEAGLNSAQHKPKSIIHQHKASRSKTLIQWSLMVAVLFLVVYFLVRMLDRQPPPS